jgi:hypothetical protein
MVAVDKDGHPDEDLSLSLSLHRQSWGLLPVSRRYGRIDLHRRCRRTRHRRHSTFANAGAVPFFKAYDRHPPLRHDGRKGGPHKGRCKA